MSLIDDVVNKKLPSGRKFRAKSGGAGNFKDKLYSATRYGSLKSLADNQDIINDLAFKRQDKIRAKGGYTRAMLEDDYSRAVSRGNLTASDKKGLRAILESWHQGNAVDNKKAQAPKKTSDNAKRAKEADERIRPAPRRELPEFLQNRAKSSINTNPWASNIGGSGGGIGAGANQGRATRRPTLLK